MSLTGRGVAITGGAGFLGSHLADRIGRDGPSNLVVIDNFFLGREENLVSATSQFPDMRVIRADASDLSVMRQIVSDHDIEVIFDLAVIPLPNSLTYPAWNVMTNVAIPTVCCEMARADDIATLIHCSSSEAYGSAKFVPMDESHPLDPVTPYAASKAAADAVVLSYHRTFGIDTAIVRPFNQFGPRQNAGSYAGIIPIVVNRVAAGLPILIHGDGEQTRDFTFAPDTADIVVRVFETQKTRGLVINAGSGNEVSVNDLVARLLEVLEKPDYPVTHVEPRPGDVRRHAAGMELAREILDVDPPGVTSENIAQTVAWYLR